MGMAASQARFLGLTGRKSNTEYQGQQVNQQRSSLANESAGLFNQMTALKVPVPPSSIDYYNSRYQFSDSLNTNTFSLKNIGDVVDGVASVGIEYSEKTVGATGREATYSGIDVANIAVEINNGTEDKVYKLSEITKTGDKFNEFSEEINAIQTARQTSGYYNNGRTSDNEQFFKYVLNGVAQIVSGYDLQDADGKTQMQTFTSKETLVKKLYSARAKFDETDSSGRYTSIAFYNVSAEDANEEPIPESLQDYIKIGATNTTGSTLSLSIGKVNDSDGYEEAMKEYEYQKMLYDRAIDDINNRTEIIQQQDKGLELKLKQLDTEQKAIQTEMEAVQKVIQKNVETTFKTFG